MSDPTATDLPTAVSAAPGRSSASDSVWRRLLRNPMAVVALVVIAVVLLASIFAPLLTSQSPTVPNLNDVLAHPGGHHLLGADSAGRDIFARIVYGGRLSLLGALVALVVALAVGLPSGLVAGYYGGWFDQVASWCANFFMALPGLIILLVVTAVIGPNIYGLMAVFGVLLSPGIFRLTRTGVVSVREELYVDAARVSGLSDARIMTNHVLRVVRAPLVVQASMMVGIGIVLQAGLQFLGIGNATDVSWGAMLSDAFNNIYNAPQLVLWPGLAIGITVAAFALFGNALRDVVQGGDAPAPKLRKDGTYTEVLPPAPSAPPVVSAFEPAQAAERAQGDTAAAPLLEVSGLRVGYPQRGGTMKIVVDGVDLHVRTGEVLGLVGESGSGKTQTAFSILGLLPEGGHVVGGQIRFAGDRIDERAGKKAAALRGKRIGYVPQEPMTNLDPSFTLGYQLAEPMRRHLGLSRAAAKDRALDLLDQVGIVDPRRTFDSYPHEVSGGMAQRVLIAGAVSCDPELLIADEPTTALDVTVQADVLDLLRDLQRERHMGVVLVTHNFGVVADICDRVAVMQHGRIVEQGDVRQIFSRPAHDYTRMLLGSTLEDAAPRPALVEGARR
jgi:ABC-type dipeptide/oligopeptide/nickel transport system ATPase component/ABC-type dipeptide/oligopeptide/nickel transport system permease subunit